MAESLMELLVKAYREPDPNPYLFEVGQRARVLKRVVEDGQTPKAWAGAIVTVERCWTTGLHKDHIYVVRRADGIVCEFKEDELDARYARVPAAAGKGGGDE
jgi:recombinational DNA repair protein (RecF pathway)